jgi:putative addiction module component (TIGR02574 family)
MAVPDIDSLLVLDVETRLLLVQRLWDSIVDDAEDGATLPVTPSDRELLEARLKEDDDDPEAAIAWKDARAELLRGR